MPHTKIAKVGIGPSDPPQIDQEKLCSCLYKLIPQACLFTIVLGPEEQTDLQQIMTETHAVQPPITPCGNLIDQAGDLEQPNTCVTNQSLIELSHQPNLDLQLQLTVEATNTVQQSSVTNNEATLNVIDRQSSSIDVDQPTEPDLDISQEITVSTHHSEELVLSSQDRFTRQIRLSCRSNYFMSKFNE